MQQAYDNVTNTLLKDVTLIMRNYPLNILLQQTRASHVYAKIAAFDVLLFLLLLLLLKGRGGGGGAGGAYRELFDR